MYVPIPVLAAAAFLLAVLAVLALRRSSRSGDLMQPPRAGAVPRGRTAGSASSAAATQLPPEILDEVRLLLSQNRKIEAIKRVREVTHLGLGEAKDLVERL